MQFIKPWFDTANESISNLLKSKVEGTGQTQVWELQQDPTKCNSSGNPPSSGSPNPNPTGSGADNTALVGTWPCQVHVKIVNKEIGAINVTVNTQFSFNKNGIGSAGAGTQAQMSGKNVSNTGPMAGGSGPYTYVPSGPDSGTLTMDSKTMLLKWSGPNAFSFSATSPVSHSTYTYNCSRQ